MCCVLTVLNMIYKYSLMLSMLHISVMQPSSGTNAHDLKKNVKCFENMLEFGRCFKLYGYGNVGILGILFCVNFQFF